MTDGTILIAVPSPHVHGRERARCPHFVEVGTRADGWFLLHGARRALELCATPPKEYEVVRGGRGVRWSWRDLKRDDPDLASRVLRANVRRRVDGEEVLVRVPMNKVRTGDVVEDSDLDPHEWL